VAAEQHLLQVTAELAIRKHQRETMPCQQCFGAVQIEQIDMSDIFAAPKILGWRPRRMDIEAAPIRRDHHDTTGCELAGYICWHRIGIGDVLCVSNNETTS
jgi:hypothetical protein